MRTLVRRVSVYLDRAHRRDATSWQDAMYQPSLNPALASDVCQTFAR